MQRLSDLILASSALFLLSPLLICICFLLRITGEGKIIYRQQRLGQNLKPFWILKFATMLEASPSMLTGSITVPDDPRVLPVGKILRKTKLNELPQLFNVFLGNMSLVGPRPHVERDLEGIPKKDLMYCYSVKPGLTGIASIIFRNEEGLLEGERDQRAFYRNVIAPYKNKLESWYVKNNKFSIYCTLIVLTIYSVFAGDSQVIFRFFPKLPLPPERLKKKFRNETTVRGG
ncbi:hypothetical protein IMCC14465_04950 [alpha proteobacterium IMCC14465]|uniref:Bacterial sugar transferase domain-containing protein n=1 Tax=alpha proteobacterium IMCC14465 TaxID=1220535 RepID=J9DJL2_9PROT|nr:hypothetical protein IMCC14465_04950 [alpha proteobacterium IMCC14465]